MQFGGGGLFCLILRPFQIFEGEAHSSRFSCLISNQGPAFTIKGTLGNVSESSKLRFENTVLIDLNMLLQLRNIGKFLSFYDKKQYL